MNTRDSDLQRLAEAIRDVKYAMLTTTNEYGSMHSRPMATLETEDPFEGKLWFFTKKNTFKVHAIERDQHVNLAYCRSEKQKFVSITGRARIIDDKSKIEELWSPMLSTWFPEGTDDPSLVLIGVEVEEAEIWDSPGGKVVKLVNVLRDAMGRGRSNNQHSEHLDLNRPS